MSMQERDNCIVGGCEKTDLQLKDVHVEVSWEVSLA